MKKGKSCLKITVIRASTVFNTLLTAFKGRSKNDVEAGVGAGAGAGVGAGSGGEGLLQFEVTSLHLKLQLKNIIKPSKAL